MRREKHTASHRRFASKLAQALLLLMLACAALDRAHPRLRIPIPARSPHHPKVHADRLTDAERDVLGNASFMAEGRPTIIATAVTRHYLDFLQNLRCWLARLGGLELAVFALDEPTLAYARKHGFASVDFSRREWKARHVHSFGTVAFNSITKRKLDVARTVLSEGFDLMFTDVDTVWCTECAGGLARIARERKDAVPELETVLMQNDAFRDGQRVVRFNSGFFFVRAARATVLMFEKMVEYAANPANSDVNDQTVVNRIGCKPVGNGRELTAEEHGRGRKVTVCRWSEQVEIESLPLAEYPNGATLFGKHKVFELTDGELLQWCKDEKVTAIHNNWIKGGEKRVRFEEHGLWIWEDRKNVCRQP